MCLGCCEDQLVFVNGAYLLEVVFRAVVGSYFSYPEGRNKRHLCNVSVLTYVLELPNGTGVLLLTWK